MKSRFKILTEDLDCLININFKFLDYPYLHYCSSEKDSCLDPFEDINKRDDYSDQLAPLVFWTKSEIIASLNTLKKHLINGLYLFERDLIWKMECLITPAQIIIEIENLINHLMDNNENRLATLVEYEY
ncbi:hypothetical protein [Psychroflexus sp. MES1-P1E]|uniref:hypothetical protein n=1 Tax=Psychroflexus sp. MES1-P1E TaxID=2058320 RepID=UPI000C79E50F|nr:hypothetical protein [Psychroflexus sp. MES1-P1E]PKG41404.1 hypothetical protein CXF67_16475 [Psychroflexus sp. MES1-P1E]